MNVRYFSKFIRTMLVTISVRTLVLFRTLFIIENENQNRYFKKPKRKRKSNVAVAHIFNHQQSENPTLESRHWLISVTWPTVVFWIKKSLSTCRALALYRFSLVFFIFLFIVVLLTCADFCVSIQLEWRGEGVRLHD